ncbi:hypothetical protein BDY19DRAFT_579559 [Irpex rosettiformis]|uniref:Uncharacterized protein n=1 Tax=Irpex rosettiformis TaxID=378272 RepID=A0ACB8UCV6_9APHY|nr:hypothetical protein BDY19DRAFT_579559 [Irpex rosettiformis]
MTSGSMFSRNRLYPKAPEPNGDVSAVKGNCSDEQKQLNLNTLAFFAGIGEPSVFGYHVAANLKLVEMNVNRICISGSSAEASGEESVKAIQGHTICEIEVQTGMLSRHGTLAGACLVHLLDITTFTALFTVGFATESDPTGASTAMDIRWHASALPGTILSIHSTTLNYKGRTVSSRAEVYDRRKGTLIASAVHTVAPLASFKDTAARKAKL